MLTMFNMLKYCKSLINNQHTLKIQSSDCIFWITTNRISNKPKNHYETLNLSRNCTSKEIREAFLTLSKQYHPDKNEGNPKAKEEFVKVNEAYNVLIKPESRRDYDFTLKTFTSPNRVYKSGKKDDFYEVHRYDSHFRDPWKDPSFYKNRNFEEEDRRSKDYYGIKGIKKLTNDQILFWIFIFAGVGIFLQISIIRFANANTKLSRDRQSELSRMHLEYVKSRAESFGTLERQIEELKRRSGVPFADDAPVSDSVKEDKPE